MAGGVGQERREVSEPEQEPSSWSISAVALEEPKLERENGGIQV